MQHDAGGLEVPSEQDEATGVPRRALDWLWTYGVYILALYLLATSKWGSYLPLGKPPYITDIVLTFVVGHRILFGQSRPGRRDDDGTLTKYVIAAFVFWSLLELARGSINITALRDFAPYFYAVTIFAVSAPPEAVRARLSRWIDIALVFHAAWITLAFAVPSFYESLPVLDGQISIFGPRNDFDGAVCGIYAAYCIHRALSERAIVLNILLAGWNVVLMLYLKERAGILAFICAMVIVFWLSGARKAITRSGRAKILVPLVILLLPLMLVVGSSTPTYQRFLTTVHSVVPFVHANPKYASSADTQSNREKAWLRIIRWQDRSIGREVVGVGFGPSFMDASGAEALLLGGPEPDVQSPHNYFVGTWARLGLIGLFLTIAVMLCGAWLAVIVKRRAPYLTDIDVLALLVLVGLPAAASVGVILESPFGAVPFFWAIGHLRVRAAELRTPAPQPVNDVPRSVPRLLPPV